MFNSLRLKDLRIEKKITQQQLADKLKVGLRTYNKYEKQGDKIQVKNLVKIADIFKVSPGSFFYEYPEPETNENSLNEDPEIKDYIISNLEKQIQSLKEKVEDLIEDKKFLKQLTKDYIVELKKKNKAG